MGKLRELHDLQEAWGDLDCLSHCPLDDEAFDPDVAEQICMECPLNSEEYAELTDHHPLFLTALEYLERYELGLADPPDTYTIKEQEAILMVHRELERWKADEARQGQKKEPKQGREMIPQKES